jgi:hypothetical protein
MYRNHPYAPLYKQAYQVMRQKAPEEQTDVHARMHFRQGTDGRRYNIPTADEIAVIIPGDGSEEVSDKRDILRLQGGELKRISQLSHAYSTLHYVLLFPSGEEGWHLDIPLSQSTGESASEESYSAALLCLPDSSSPSSHGPEQHLLKWKTVPTVCGQCLGLNRTK